LKLWVRVLLNTLFWFVLALLFAATYASIETGPYAQSLPVWRPEPNIWWVKLLYWVPNLGRPVNGLDTFGLLFLGATCLLLIPIWNALHHRPVSGSEFLELLAYFITIAVIEDWVWYAINPNAGLKHFNEASLPRWMYKAWLFGFPDQYWQGAFASYIALWGSVKTRQKNVPLRTAVQQSLSAFVLIWGFMVLLVLLTAIAANYTWMHHQNF
jgi:hypothetical protein